MTQQPTKDNKGALTYSATLSAVSLALLQSNPLEWDDSIIATLTIIAPLIITTVVALAYWGFVLLDGKTTSQIIVERQWNERIDFLEERLKLFPDDPDLRKELKEVILARSKLFTQTKQ